MKGIYDFSRNPAHRDCTVAGLKALKGSGRKLSMSNPADPEPDHRFWPDAVRPVAESMCFHSGVGLTP